MLVWLQARGSQHAEGEWLRAGHYGLALGIRFLPGDGQAEGQAERNAEWSAAQADLAPDEPEPKPKPKAKKAKKEQD